jgi:hypothetical protein
MKVTDESCSSPSKSTDAPTSESTSTTSATPPSRSSSTRRRNSGVTRSLAGDLAKEFGPLFPSSSRNIRISTNHPSISSKSSPTSAVKTSSSSPTKSINTLDNIPFTNSPISAHSISPFEQHYYPTYSQHLSVNESPPSNSSSAVVPLRKRATFEHVSTPSSMITSFSSPPRTSEETPTRVHGYFDQLAPDDSGSEEYFLMGNKRKWADEEVAAGVVLEKEGMVAHEVDPYEATLRTDSSYSIQFSQKADRKGSPFTRVIIILTSISSFPFLVVRFFLSPSRNDIRNSNAIISTTRLHNMRSVKKRAAFSAKSHYLNLLLRCFTFSYLVYSTLFFIIQYFPSKSVTSFIPSSITPRSSFDFIDDLKGSSRMVREASGLDGLMIVKDWFSKIAHSPAIIPSISTQLQNSSLLPAQPLWDVGRLKHRNIRYSSGQSFPVS